MWHGLYAGQTNPIPFPTIFRSPARTRYRVLPSTSPSPPLLSPSRSIPLKVKLPTLCIVAPNTRKFGHRTLLLLFPLSVSLSLSSRRPAGWSYVTMRFAVRNQRSTLTTGWRSQKKRESARGWYLNLGGGGGGGGVYVLPELRITWKCIRAT